jgi:hypothetical protein
MTSSWSSDHDRQRWLRAARLGGAFLFVLLLAGVCGAGVNTSPITGVTVSPATANVYAGGAFYLRAAVQGTGDFDHRVNWSLSPVGAGTVTPTGLFIADPGFTGAAAVKATSVEAPTFSGTATITVAAGGGVLHVDRNNEGPTDGSALYPYRFIQDAIYYAADGDTIKVAQGTYIENVGLFWNIGVLLLGGFEGGSAAQYAYGLPGDFVHRSTDHVNRVTTIQSPNLNNPVVDLGTWGWLNPLTYAVDGFTLTGGANGVKAAGSGPVTFFISQNLIINNGVLVGGPGALGGGINASGINTLVLNNRIAHNQSGFGGGIRVETDANTFLVQGNLIENNDAGGDMGGGVVLGQYNQGQGTGRFTWNIVRGNRANLLLTYGAGGGLIAGGGPLELSHNSYADNETQGAGGGICIGEGSIAVLRHELVYKNRTASTYAGAGIYVFPNGTQVSLDHCTITGNTAPGTEGNGLKVREQATVQVNNSIIWGNSGDQLYVYPGATFAMTYSDSQPYAGPGNLSVDPLFADPATDDYHLKSRRGRWNPATSQWVTDAVQSPCIDAGNPLSAYDQEPFHNGARTNMGAYGNTPEASKSLCDPMIGLWYYFLIEN